MEIDLETLEHWKRKNQAERLKFVREYGKWLKQTPNKKWSRQQAKLGR